MDIPVKASGARKEIDIIVFTGYRLVREKLALLLESKSEISVRDYASTPDELINKVSDLRPDVVLFCLMEDEMSNVEALPKVFEVSSDTKVVILSALNGKLDQKKVLEMGATGIVGAHQKEESLIRTIRQVADGEVCLNRDLMAQLLNNGTGDQAMDRSATGERPGFPQTDPLTNRELEVIETIAQGMTNKEISKKLFISEATVRHHLSSIYSKLYVEDRLNLVIYAFQNKIVKFGNDE